MKLSALLLCMSGLISSLLCGSVAASEFSFSETEAREEAEEVEAEVAASKLIQELLATPCSRTLKNRKTALVIAERKSEGGIETEQKNYGLHFGEINRCLQEIGLRTYTQEEIAAQIRNAEVQALMNNDPDAQISAASRLGASFILRGIIESRTSFNPVAKVNEVHVTITFSLVDASGKSVANVSESADSFSGADTTSVALELVKSKADLVVAKLYSEYCENAR